MNSAPIKKELPIRVETDPGKLRASVLSRIQKDIFLGGELEFPAIPQMAGAYTKLLLNLFDSVGSTFNEAESNSLLKAVEGKLNEAFHRAPNSKIIVRYLPANNGGIDYTVEPLIRTIANFYDQHPFSQSHLENQAVVFGMHPDAKFANVAKRIPGFPEINILDLGAGVGRNSIPLALMGCKIEAVEALPAFANTMRQQIQEKHAQNIQVVNVDFFSPLLNLPANHYDLVLASEVVSHFRDKDQLHQFMMLAAGRLKSEGELLLNIHLADQGYSAESYEKEMSQYTWTKIFSREEVAAVAASLHLELVEENEACEYEMTHLPQSAWPHTDWYEHWARGGFLYDLPEGSYPPVRLYWMQWIKLK